MPIYTYRCTTEGCDKCGKHFDTILPVEHGAPLCSSCGNVCKKVYQPFAFRFKGPGGTLNRQFATVDIAPDAGGNEIVDSLLQKKGS